MSRQMSNALYIKTATKKPLTSGLNAFMSRKSGNHPMRRAKKYLAFCGYVATLFGGIGYSKVATYNHFKVYDVCSFHSG